MDLPERSRCCQTAIRPLLLRIEQLEGKLLCEVERRENEYNELLHLLLTIKRSTTGHSPLSFTRPIAARTLPAPTPEPHPRPKKKNILAAKRKTAPSQEKVERSQPKSNLGKAGLEQRVEEVERVAEQHKVELEKGKELNEYLMEQLLGIYEKIRELEALPQHKEFSSLETIPSLLVDPLSQQQLRAFHSLPSEEKLPQLDSVYSDSQAQWRQITAKLNEHESVLSELIGLTRGLNARLPFSS
jgi:hypothetical protein